MPDEQLLPSGVVTFLLTDIEGSTALWDRSPTAMTEALQRHERIVADAVAANSAPKIADPRIPPEDPWVKTYGRPG